MTPEVALQRFDAGEIQLPPPTLRTLEQLRDLSTIDDVLTHARAWTRRIVQPHFTNRSGTPTLTLPGDPDHPESTRAIEGPTRFVLDNGRFRSADPPTS
jgi:hypothetical protein